MLEIGLGHAVVETGGVGVEILMPPSALAELRVGAEARVVTTLVVREDSLTLYGFADAASRDVFTLVQSVSGVGPRMALALVATIAPDSLFSALSSGNTSALMAVPGVGRRIAERMIVDLKGKIPQVTSSAQGETAGASLDMEVLGALQGLGFSDKESKAALSQVSTVSGQSAAQILKLALAHLGGK